MNSMGSLYLHSISHSTDIASAYLLIINGACESEVEVNQRKFCGISIFMVHGYISASYTQTTLKAA